MATNVTWDGTVYSIPAAGEYNWATLSNFLIALGNKAAVAGVVKQAIRKATSSPVTVSATTDYAVVTDLTVAGAVAVNLPAGVNGQVFIVCDGKADAATNNVTINAAGSDTIKGQATLVMNKNRQVVMLQYNSGDNDWKVLNYGVPVGQVTDSDISGSISTAGKVANSATTATSTNTASAIVARDGSGNFTAGTITATLNGNASNVSGTVAIANGGTGQTTQQAALNALAGSQVANRVLRSDGTNTQLSQVNLATDVGGTLPIGNGGTGAATQQAAINSLVGTQTANRVLRSNGTNMSLAQVALGTDVSGTLPLANGGTGATTQQAAMNALAGTQTANRVLRSDGSNTTLSQVDLISDVIGALPIANGGTGQTTANNALNALLPNQSPSANKYLKTNGTNSFWASASGGSGEINAVLNPTGADGSSGWLGLDNITPIYSGASVPLNPIVTTAFNLTNTAVSPQTSTTGAYYSFNMPTGLQNRKLKVEFYYLTPATDVWQVAIYKSTTRVPLSTDDSTGKTVLPANTNGKFVAYFDTDLSPFWSVNVTRTSGSTGPCYITNVIVGPGIQPQGAVVGEWASYTPSGGDQWTTNTTYSGRYRRVGDTMELFVSVAAGSTTPTGGDTSVCRIALPSGFTIDATKINSSNANESALGTWQGTITGVGNIGGQVRKHTSNTQIELWKVNPAATDYKTSFASLTAAEITNSGAQVGKAFAHVTVPIAEWAGSGTVQLAQNDVIFYGGTGGTWGTSSTLTTTQGPGGVQGGTTTPSGTFFSYTIVPTSPMGVGVTPKIELSSDGKNWGTPGQGVGNMNLVENIRFDGTNYIGCAATATATGSINVIFGKYAWGASGAWAGTWYWRIVVAQPGAAVGFGIVQPGVSSGLVSASGVPGNTTGNAIASGYVGQSLEATTGPTNLTTAQYSTLSLTLGAGVWLVTGMINYIRNGATITGLSYNAQIVPSGSGNPSNNFYYAIHDSSFSSSYNTCTVQAPATVVRCDGTNITVPGFTSQVTDAIQLRFYAGTFTGGPVQASAVVRAIRIA